VSGLEVGTPVAVYGPWGCGRCYQCAQGKENYCTEAARLNIRPPGLGVDGTMADYLLVPDVRHLVPLGGLDPVAAVALTDAGLTPYHAIKGSLGRLVPGSTAVVIGAGGLGHVAIQILRGLTATTVIALDVSDEKLALATEVGAQHTLLSDTAAPDHIRDLVGPRGVTAVFDFVTVQSTIDLGRAVIGTESDVVLVGVGAGQAQVGMLAAPYDASIRAPYWGSRSELMEVLELARAGVLHVATETFALDDGPQAYRRLHDGMLLGRAVVIP
jgi:propanol-preferring alcohol dehydrogenase